MKYLKEISEGEIFGEIALMNNVKRTATIMCMTECYFATLTKNQFFMIV